MSISFKKPGNVMVSKNLNLEKKNSAALRVAKFPCTVPSVFEYSRNRQLPIFITCLTGLALV